MPLKNKPTLIFVYNADGGLFNLAADIAHKIFSPQTYKCNLCALTHGAFKMNSEWRRYLDALDAQFEFLHADEFKGHYADKITEKLPAVFKLENGGVELLISANEINRCRDISDLKQIVNARLENFPPMKNV